MLTVYTAHTGGPLAIFIWSLNQSFRQISALTSTQPLVGVVPLAGPQVGSRVRVPVGASPVFSVARKKIGALNL